MEAFEQTTLADLISMVGMDAPLVLSSFRALTGARLKALTRFNLLEVRCPCNYVMDFLSRLSAP